MEPPDGLFVQLVITNKHIAVCRINVNGDRPTLWWRISRCELSLSKDGSTNEHVTSFRGQMQTIVFHFWMVQIAANSHANSPSQKEGRRPCLAPNPHDALCRFC